MKKLYLDIDGVLLTTKNPVTPSGIDEFIQFIISNFDCYWLTTHCKGETSSCISYLAQYLSKDNLNALSNVKPTNWETLKTEAIDMSESFYWLDDYTMSAEKRVLQSHGKINSLVTVNLNNINELERIIELLKNNSE